MKDICQNCHQHKATTNWVGDGGQLAYLHGAYERWCDCCCARAQLRHAMEMVAKIPELEKALVLAETQCAVAAGRDEVVE